MALTIAAGLLTGPHATASEYTINPDRAGPSAPVVRAQPMPALPPGGEWVRYGDRSVEARPVSHASSNQSQLVVPVPQPCRPRTSNYRPPWSRFNCLAYYRANANTGHPVLLRQGQAGETGFGYLHALVDHGLDEETIATVIVNNGAGILQNNGRHLYGLEYRVSGVGFVRVEVYEERRPPREFRDGDGVGVVTVFCLGFDGRCPEGINESLP